MLAHLKSNQTHPVCFQLGGIGLEAGCDSEVVEAEKAAAGKGDVDLVIHGEEWRCSSRRIRSGAGGKEDWSSLGYQASPASCSCYFVDPCTQLLTFH